MKRHFTRTVEWLHLQVAHDFAGLEGSTDLMGDEAVEDAEEEDGQQSVHRGRDPVEDVGHEVQVARLHLGNRTRKVGKADKPTLPPQVKHQGQENTRYLIICLNDAAMRDKLGKVL